MGRYFVGLLAVIVVTLSGCPGDPNARGGPYYEFTPGTEIDLGDVDRDTEAEATVTIANVGLRSWEMEINEGSLPSNVEFLCADGDNETCLTVDPYGEHDWTVVVHTFCDDHRVANIRLHFSDPESTGDAANLGDVTLTVTWETTGC
jgi:hypothetical protein